MTTSKWTVNFLIRRQKDQTPSYLQEFTLEVDPDEYLLDSIERIWAFEDRSLTFRHACHHSVCGACGMRVDGVEKLTCITLVGDVTTDGGAVKVEPLRNFPVVSDLVVDMSNLYAMMEVVDDQQVKPLAQAPVTTAGPQQPVQPEGEQELWRLVDCIECGMCISACPVAATNPDYLGPAVLAAAQQQDVGNDSHILKLVDSEGGVWRCHSAFECTEVCPAQVEPAWRIMALRRQVIKQRVKSFLRLE